MDTVLGRLCEPPLGGGQSAISCPFWAMKCWKVRSQAKRRSQICQDGAHLTGANHNMLWIEPLGTPSGPWGEVDVRGPVSRVLLPRKRGDDHFSGTGVAAGLQRSTREAWARVIATCSPYLTFLREGFALPALSPGPRCALTAPFHPYRPSEPGRRFAFCGTFPGLATGCR